MPVCEVYERETIRFELVEVPDPFAVDDPCPTNAGGPHNFKPDCGDVVCVQCGRVAP